MVREILDLLKKDKKKFSNEKLEEQRKMAKKIFNTGLCCDALALLVVWILILANCVNLLNTTIVAITIIVLSLIGIICILFAMRILITINNA